MAADASTPSSRVQSQLRSRIGRIKGLLAGPHGPGSPVFEHLVERSSDYELFYEDFDATVITATTGPFTAGVRHTLTYAESNAGAGDPAKLAPTRTQTSDLKLDTTANAYNQSIIGPKMYVADHYPFIEVRFMVSKITGYQMTIGFADAIAASAGVIVSDIDTPGVATVADGAFYAIDVSQTLATAALVAVGTSTAVSKVNVAPTTAPFGIPTVSTYLTVRVTLEGNGQVSGPSIARLFINDALVATNTGGPDSEKLLSPVFYQGALSGATLESDIDYIKCGQQKAGSPF